MFRIKGYAYEADYHCISCTKRRLESDGFKIQAASPADDISELDENGIPYATMDHDGNYIHPIFSTDELPYDDNGRPMDIDCGDCHDTIMEA